VPLVAAAIGALWLADTYASDATTYCSINLKPWQGLGCAMAAHEGLAAGLTGVPLVRCSQAGSPLTLCKS
jgi:hypothetical protein